MNAVRLVHSACGTIRKGKSNWFTRLSNRRKYSRVLLGMRSVWSINIPLSSIHGGIVPFDDACVATYFRWSVVTLETSARYLSHVITFCIADWLTPRLCMANAPSFKRCTGNVTLPVPIGTTGRLPVNATSETSKSSSFKAMMTTAIRNARAPVRVHFRWEGHRGWEWGRNPRVNTRGPGISLIATPPHPIVLDTCR